MKTGSEIGFPKFANHAVGGTYNAVRLSSALPAELTVCGGRATVRRSLTDAAVSDRYAEEPHAH